MDAVRTQKLVKRYGAAEILHGIDLTVPLGALFGFLGPNGAGKTTTIRILLGLLKPTAGGALVLGHDAWREGPAARSQIGYLPGDARFYEWLTGGATLDFFFTARGGRDRSELNRLVRVFDLHLDLQKRVRSYSRGMKQKLGLIAALMHRPHLLILDEPTTALDPLVRQHLFDELQAVVADGRTVLFSSHTLSEVEQLCDHVAILGGGRLLEQSTIELLRRRAVRRVEITFAPGAAPQALPDGLRRAGHPPPAGAGALDGVLHAAWVGPVEALVAWLASQRIRDVSIGPPDLEDLFLAYYEQSEGAR
ncbi:MAG: ABC transporter ATP-binding protein [Phycisphaerae bacterium]